MKLNFDDLTITITPEALAKALKPHGYRLTDDKTPTERKQFTQARKHIRGTRAETFYNGKPMTVYEALTKVVPEALQAFKADDSSISRMNHAFKSRFTSTDMYNYIKEAVGCSILAAQLQSAVQFGRMMSALYKESPLFSKVALGNKNVYVWNPGVREWRLQAVYASELPMDERTDEQHAQIAYHLGNTWLPADLCQD